MIYLRTENFYEKTIIEFFTVATLVVLANMTSKIVLADATVTRDKVSDSVEIISDAFKTYNEADTALNNVKVKYLDDYGSYRAEIVPTENLKNYEVYVTIRNVSRGEGGEDIVVNVAKALSTSKKVVPEKPNDKGANKDKVSRDNGKNSKQPKETNIIKEKFVSMAGWIQSSGRWWYRHNNGAYTTDGWELINGIWYYFDHSGWMKTGWIKTSGVWYYLSSSGAMQTGWVKTDGLWYYLNSSGAMQTGCLKTGGKWYYLNSSGTMKTGWFTVSGKWYYAYNSGALAVNTITPDGYRVNTSGEWIR